MEKCKLVYDGVPLNLRFKVPPKLAKIFSLVPSGITSAFYISVPGPPTLAVQAYAR